MAKMYLEDGVRIIAGSIVIVSLLLGMFVNKWWFFLTLFVGVNLIQSVFTGICPAERVLEKFGLKRRR